MYAARYSSISSLYITHSYHSGKCATFYTRQPSYLHLFVLPHKKNERCNATLKKISHQIPLKLVWYAAEGVLN